MKKLLWPALALALATPVASRAAEDDAPNSAAAAAARQNAEERYSRLSATLEDLMAAHVKLQQRVASLTAEVQSLREDQARAASQAAARFATHEDLKKLLEKVQEKIQELDRKREEDKRLILEEIHKLATLPAPAPIVIREPAPRETEKPAPPEPTPPAPPPAPVTQKGYEYSIGERDTLEAIVTSYRKKGVKVTVDQVLKANPGLKPNRMRIGQKIFIPDPGQP
jgi:predicted RNase H-like nuclease (RuvC/YqgF family)